MQIETIMLFDFNKTVSGKLLKDYDTPWKILPCIKEIIIQIGNSLSEKKFERVQNDVWIAKNASVAPTADISGPCIIDECAEIRHFAFIRGSAIIGKNCVVGNSTELKNCILFDNVQVPHFNYIGDSILGFKAHLGAGAVTSNVKSDKTLVKIKCDGETIETGLKKFGALVGDFSEVGCNSVLCPGTVLGRNCTVYPTSCVRGYIKENHIFKNDGVVVEKR